MVTPLAVGSPIYKENEKLSLVSEPSRYQVIKASSFRDHRPAFAGPLSWTRPKQLDFNEIKDLARASKQLLLNWRARDVKGPDQPLVNGFKISPNERRLKQVVFLLSLQEQERLVWNRSIWFWKQLSDGNNEDLRAIFGALELITEAESFEHHVFPHCNKEAFYEHVNKSPHHKRAFMTLHQMLKFLKNFIYLQMYSPCFDFRFCELQYEFEPINSWNPLPCDTQSQSSLYQTKHQFQKLSDFLLVTDQIHAMVNVLTYETSRWRQKITSTHSMLHEMSPEIDPKWIAGGNSCQPEQQPGGQPAQIRLLGFDHQKLSNGQSFSILRLLVLAANKAVILTLALDGVSKTIKKLIARSEIRKHNIESYIKTAILNEEKYSHVVIVDKYVALYEQATLQFKDQKGNPRYLPGPSLTMWDRNGKFKEQFKLTFPPSQSGLTFALKRMPGKRFTLVQKNNFGEASSLVFTLGCDEPVVLKGEIEDSSSNYFCLRIADHVQFYTYTDNVQRHPTYLFSIRSFNDERIKLCSGGQERFATSRITLTYHIQVFDFPEIKKPKLNARNGSTHSEKIVGQNEMLSDAMEPLTYLKPYMTFTRPFKQSQTHNYESRADIRLRILAMASGSWQIDEKDQPVPSPGENFGLCPGGLLIHDIQHNLLLFQPISDECRQQGRLLLSLKDLAYDQGSSEYFLPLGRAWGRLCGPDMHFYSQRASTGALSQHKFSFGSGALTSSPTPSDRRPRPKKDSKPRGTTRIRFDVKNDLPDELSFLSLD